MKTRGRIVGTVLALSVALGFGVSPAAAGFYRSGGCTVDGNRFNVTNYSKGAGQEYHVATYPGSGYLSNTITVGGIKVGSKSGPWEAFVYKSNPTYRYTVTVKFYARGGEGNGVSCSYRVY